MRTKSILAALALMISAVVLVLAPAGPASAAYTAYVRIHQPPTTSIGPLVIDMKDYSQSDGGVAQLWILRTSGTTANQRWTINQLGTTGDFHRIVQLKNALSGRCLTAAVVGDKAVKQYGCNDTDRWQRWIAKRKSGNWSTLVNEATGTCIDSRGYGYGDGVVLQTYTCHGDWNQQFNIEP